MVDTHHMLLYHFVFSTKCRKPWFPRKHQIEIFEYLGGTIRGLKGVPIRVGGWIDHVHLLVKLRTTHCIADFMRDVKSNSSKHIDQLIGAMHKFGWQDGYGVFTVSGFRNEKVIQYIENQEQHHTGEDSRSEYIRMLNVHGVEYDEQYPND